MKVAELMGLLARLDPDDDVLIAVDTNNYWRQVAALNPVAIEPKRVRFSEYLNSDEMKDDDDEDSEDQRHALLIFTR